MEKTMEREYRKDLWLIRFQKILEGEKEAFFFYQNLLKMNEAILEGTETKEILEQIKRDEAKHAIIAQQLVSLIKQKRNSTLRGKKR